MARKTVSICLLSFILGFSLIFGLVKFVEFNPLGPKNPLHAITPFLQPQQEIIGFLPYWLISRADKDYNKYLTTLTYFGISISPDGSLVKFAKPGEQEPGWYALESGLADPFFTKAKTQNIKLSLLLFSGVPEDINALISDPASHAATLISEVAPIMKQYGFTDLNLDIESVAQATPGAQANFTSFVREVRNGINRQNLGTLSLESSPTDLIRPRLINPAEVAPLVDHWVLMAYDYHYPGSAVTGPIAPVGGAGNDSEFDVETGIQKALNDIPQYKIVLGLPLYGYEWETLGDVPRSAVLPGSGAAASNRRMEQFVAGCATCSAKADQNTKETYVIYKDQKTTTFHQVFYPDTNSTAEKIKLINKYQLGGAALWALGYDGDTILNPLTAYKQLIVP